ncbi:PadR family transcriptional regulator [Rhizobium sp. BK376]|nr:PadR family transcriptional regulator [Rhizobium sp. BK376]
MRGFHGGRFGGGFHMAEAYMFRHGGGHDSRFAEEKEFMRGFKGGMFGGGFRTGRKFDAADLQLIILALLSEQPRHGYELIKTLEERSGGFYVPSPGVIYPALTYLEETGLTEVEVSGTKKLYSITEAGRKRVEENRVTIELTLSKLERIGEKMEHVRRVFGREDDDAGEDRDRFDRDAGDIRVARQLLRSALRSRYPWSKEEGKRIAAILEQAAADILRARSEPDEE